MNILITGFGSFSTYEDNPTKEILKLLPTSIYGNKLIKVELPVVYDESFDFLLPFIEKYEPGIIINLGLSGGRKAINLERVAININSNSVSDNDGNLHIDDEIIEGGKNAYFSTLPLRNIERKMQEKRIPVVISNSAGTYVCNNIMYHVLRYISINNLDIKAGFIHVPFMTEQLNNKDINSLPLDIILEGVIDAIKGCL